MKHKLGTQSLHFLVVLHLWDRSSAVFFPSQWLPCSPSLSDCCLPCSRQGPGCKHREGILWCFKVQHGKSHPHSELAVTVHKTSDVIWASPLLPPIQVPSTSFREALLPWGLPVHYRLGWWAQGKIRSLPWLPHPWLGHGARIWWAACVEWQGRAPGSWWGFALLSMYPQVQGNSSLQSK